MTEYKTEYTIIQGNDWAELVALVRDCITRGWLPQGGVAAKTSAPKYLQAMVRAA